MTKVHFTDDFDFSPEARKNRVTICYKRGMVETVTRECAEKAIAAGKAEEVKPRKAAETDDGA